MSRTRLEPAKPGPFHRVRILAADAGLGPDNPDFLVVSGPVLPYATGSFGSVLYLSSLHELPDREASLAEAGRVLGPEGRCGSVKTRLPGDVSR